MLSHSSTWCHVPCLVPTPGMEYTFQEYQSFSDSVVVSEDNLPAYTRAKKKLEGYRPFENQLVRSDTVGISAVLFPGLPQRLTSLVPKQLACFIFLCVCVFLVCLFCTTSNEKIGRCLGTWAVESFQYRPLSPSLPTVQFWITCLGTRLSTIP